MATLQEHYTNIISKIKDLRTAVLNCKTETGLLADIEFKVLTSFEINSKGETVQKIESPFIRFDGFKVIGVVSNEDRDLKRLYEKSITKEEL